MDTTDWVIVAIVAGVLVLGAIALMAVGRSRRRAGLRERFGPEYDRTVNEQGSRRHAERELREREERFESLETRPLPEEARNRYTADWERAERLFVDDPELAAREADRIVRSVLDDRGYPNDDLETQTAAVSVEHPHAVQRYRHGHEMVHDGGNGNDRTENLRTAMVDFRTVFEEMVEPEHEIARR
jgi:hypothetical protein